MSNERQVIMIMIRGSSLNKKMHMLNYRKNWLSLRSLRQVNWSLLIGLIS